MNDSTHNGSGAFGPGLHQLVAIQAVKTPERIAVEHGDDQISYRELMLRARSLAADLAGGGIAPGDVVAVAIAPSIEAVTALLGILEAGAVYLPLDSSMPPARMELMLRDSGAAAVVVGGQAPFALPAGIPRTFELAHAEQADPAGDDLAPLDLSRIAYVIYTSGSTGTPKGVAVTHGNAVNLIESMTTRVSTTDHDRVLQTAALAFDASVEEIFVSLARGATLVISQAWQLSSTRHLIDVSDGITVMNLPTPLLHALALDMADDPSLTLPDSIRLIITGGEKLRPESARMLIERIDPSITLLDMYGPTETTVTALVADVRADWIWGGDDPLPSLGGPIANATVSIRDPELRSLPAGEVGEIVIGGAGVAAGYVGHAAAKASAFVDDPDEPGQRLYRTGDYARRCEDGRLLFLGRKDAQVKVRGFRIEVGEVEAAVSRLDGIRDAAVVAREDQSGQVELVAYFTAPAPYPSTFDLRAGLARDLPAYMIPARFVALDEIPRLPSGKVDRPSLADPATVVRPAVTDTPEDSTPLTRDLSKIFADVLDLSAVGSGDDFFHLGGHSLSAMRVVSRVSRQYDVDLPPNALTSWPTARQLADALEGELQGSVAR